LLAELMQIRRIDPAWLVVCGGSALQVSGIISRSTRDVDVLARRELEGEVSPASPLPAALKEAASDVARRLGLSDNWLNASTSLFFPDLAALPSSFWADLHDHEFGDSLKVSFVGRTGQILLKLYAVCGREEMRDWQDLLALAPTESEAIAAAQWIRKHVDGLASLDRLQAAFRNLGFQELWLVSDAQVS
jgi:hypothetical protein